MKKKGVEMSMNVIIIAAIGLLILLILAFLVVNYVNKTNTGLKSCTVSGGVCKDSCGLEDPVTTEKTECTEKGQQCCKVLG